MSRGRMGQRQRAAIGRSIAMREMEREVGNRPGVARAMRLEEDAFIGPLPNHDVENCDTFGCEVCLAYANRGVA